MLPRKRLLHCHTCKTIEELDDFSGPADYDTILQYALDKHRRPNGEPHIGRLYPIEGKIWALQNLREAIIAQLKGGGSLGLASVWSDYYDVKDTLSEDAMTCFNKHLRPPADCHDWRSKSKELTPGTQKERKEVGLSAPRVTTYLCDFCPVNQHYEKKRNAALHISD